MIDEYFFRQSLSASLFVVKETKTMKNKEIVITVEREKINIEPANERK